jgi:hypothetical protein
MILLATKAGDGDRTHFKLLCRPLRIRLAIVLLCRPLRIRLAIVLAGMAFLCWIKVTQCYYDFPTQAVDVTRQILVKRRLSAA